MNVDEARGAQRIFYGGEDFAGAEQRAGPSVAEDIPEMYSRAEWSVKPKRPTVIRP